MGCLFYGMETMRMTLHPMGGAGSQSWNHPAYMILGEFIAGKARDYRKDFGYE